MGRRIAIYLTTALLLAVPVPTSAARQLDARREPSASGPLTLYGSKCNPRRMWHEGQVVARAVVCAYGYTLTTVAELDALRDYGVAWIQATLDPEAGWCVTDFAATVLVDSGGRITSHVPRGISRKDRAKSRRVRLAVDGNGTAWYEGEVSQSYVQLPNHINVALRSRSAGDVFVLRWKGSTASEVALVGGAEASFDALDSGPEFAFAITRYALREGPC